MVSNVSLHCGSMKTGNDYRMNKEVQVTLAYVQLYKCTRDNISFFVKVNRKTEKCLKLKFYQNLATSLLIRYKMFLQRNEVTFVEMNGYGRSVLQIQFHVIYAGIQTNLIWVTRLWYWYSQMAFIIQTRWSFRVRRWRDKR